MGHRVVESGALNGIKEGGIPSECLHCCHSADVDIPWLLSQRKFRGVSASALSYRWCGRQTVSVWSVVTCTC